MLVVVVNFCPLVFELNAAAEIQSLAIPVAQERIYPPQQLLVFHHPPPELTGGFGLLSAFWNHKYRFLEAKMRTLATMKGELVDLENEISYRKESPEKWFRVIARYLVLREEIRRTENLILGVRNG